MTDRIGDDLRASYARVAHEYARRIADELEHRPLDRQLLDRFAEEVRGLGPAWVLGCGPGHVASSLQDRGVPVSVDFHFFDTEEMVSLLRAAGFEVVEVIERGSYTDVGYPSRRAYLFAQGQGAAGEVGKVGPTTGDRHRPAIR